MDIIVKALAKSTGADITAVPFAGGGPATTAMVGRLRILAVATPERDPSLPDVPTLKELGINFTNAGSLKGIAAPLRR